jgi:hypothetical protein
MWGFLLTMFVVVVAGALFGGWIFMLTVGVVHGEWLPMMPTIGYWSAVKVSAMLSLLFGLALGASSR